MSTEDDLREEWQHQQLHGAPRYPQGGQSGCFWKLLVLLAVLLILGYLVYQGKLGLPLPD